MASYSFKSVGKSQDEVELEAIKSTTVAYGIKTPLKLSAIDGFLEMNYSVEDQFADNLKNLLLTNWGERLGHYNFGANLRPIATELISSQDDFDTEAIARIKNAVNKWMPFIDLESFTSKINFNENKNTGVIAITVVYNIPFLKVANKSIQVVLYVI